MPAAGGIGQQSSGQILHAMASGQMTVGQMTITQLWSIGGIFKKFKPFLKFGKKLLEMSSPGVGAGSFGAMSASGVTAQEFDSAIQALESGSFSIEKMQLNELNVLNELVPELMNLANSFSQVPEEPQGVAEQDSTVSYRR